MIHLFVDLLIYFLSIYSSIYFYLVSIYLFICIISFTFFIFIYLYHNCILCHILFVYLSILLSLFFLIFMVLFTVFFLIFANLLLMFLFHHFNLSFFCSLSFFINFVSSFTYFLYPPFTSITLPSLHGDSYPLSSFKNLQFYIIIFYITSCHNFLLPSLISLFIVTSSLTITHFPYSYVFSEPAII